MIRALCLAAIAGAGALLLGVHLTFGQQGHVIGSKHDVSSLAVSACQECHIPHDPYGEFVWAHRMDRAGGLYVGLETLCYSCHDGTVTEGGEYAFDESLAQHPTTSGEHGKECGMCHDPHTAGHGNFLLFPAGANFCKSCHARAGRGDHPLNVDVTTADYLAADVQWDPDSGDFRGTRLWDASGTAPGDEVKCLSCHAAHGGVPGTALNTMPYRDRESVVSPLCQNCHP